MAKILVADDNSNIQKMVGLALKDQGIDVVAVGNGEAAVRKISDVKPDLVLADVFMPVRNGYEVCQYVKGDSALAHIPVILLVGAFDPLDEQEAQRVGADGVLKKPFVPPDPLISMVKSALTRAGVSLGPKEPEPEPVKAEPFKPLAMNTAPPPPIVEETPLEDIPVRPAPISIDRGAQPLAFGNLLETTPEVEQDVAELVSPPRMERDWKSGSEDEEMDVEEETEESGPSWRPGGADLEDDGIPAGKKDWREAAFANISDAPSTPAYSGDSEVESAAELVGAEQNASPAPSAYASGNSWSSPASGSVPSPEAIVMPDIISVTQVQASVPVEAPASAAAEPPAPPAPVEVAAPANNSWMSVAPSPWDAEVAKASKLAATWDTAVAVATEPTPVSATTTTSVADIAPDPTPEQVAAALPASAVEEIREEAAHVVEQAEPEVPQTAPSTHAPAASEPNLDEMVAKVLSRMDPSVLQAMTKELLKPVIESIVREELNKK
ncbi:MAG: response regulator [Acidobacteria bacterium]|nr:response regulator [Acidobacteriota bacterium]MBS1866623.1 response regulator [Acidobacteriota bacterium]